MRKSTSNFVKESLFNAIEIIMAEYPIYPQLEPPTKEMVHSHREKKLYVFPQRHDRGLLSSHLFASTNVISRIADINSKTYNLVSASVIWNYASAHDIKSNGFAASS